MSACTVIKQEVVESTKTHEKAKPCKNSGQKKLLQKNYISRTIWKLKKGVLKPARKDTDSPTRLRRVVKKYSFKKFQE